MFSLFLHACPRLSTSPYIKLLLTSFVTNAASFPDWLWPRLLLPPQTASEAPSQQGKESFLLNPPNTTATQKCSSGLL